MAPKRKNPPPPPPPPKPLPASSDENEEEEEEVVAASYQDDDVADQSESEPDESSDDNEQPQVDPTVPNPNRHQLQSESESDGEEEDHGSDSESDSNPKPLASMPPVRSVQPNPAATQSPNNTSKKLFQRLYSEEDELVVLKGMIQFKEETGKDAMDELNEYYEFVKDAIHVPVTKDQFVHKVKRLKGRYDKNLKSGRACFTNAHEQALYDVSKEIWGTDIANVNGGVKRKRGGVKRKAQFEEVGTLCLRETVRSQEAVGVRLSEEFYRRSLELVGEREKAELDREWMELLVGEKEMHLKRVELVLKVMKVSLTAAKALKE